MVVLTEKEAENAWKVRLGSGAAGDGGNTHLLITAQDFFADPDGQRERIWLRSRGNAEFAFNITPPPPAAPQSSLLLVQADAHGQTVRFTAEAAPRNPELKYTQVQPAGDAPRVQLGPAPTWRGRGVAQAPGEDIPPYAARWSVTLPPDALEGLSDLYLQVTYRGDLARLTAGNKLLTDNFYNGKPWSIGLRRFMESKDSNSFELSLLPLRKDAPVYFEWVQQPEFGANGQVDALDDLRLVPEYQLVLTDNAGR